MESDIICKECGKKLIIKSGRFGDFLGCRDYPACKHTEPIIDDTGYLCPNCGGKVLNRKTKKGFKYISCENYSKCGFSSWGTITKQLCPKCNNFLLKVYEDKKALIKCSSDKCDYNVPFVKVSKKGDDE